MQNKVKIPRNLLQLVAPSSLLEPSDAVLDQQTHKDDEKPNTQYDTKSEDGKGLICANFPYDVLVAHCFILANISAWKFNCSPWSETIRVLGDRMRAPYTVGLQVQYRTSCLQP